MKKEGRELIFELMRVIGKRQIQDQEELDDEVISYSTKCFLICLGYCACPWQFPMSLLHQFVCNQGRKGKTC